MSPMASPLPYKPIDALGSNGRTIFISCIVFPPISLFILGLRLYCRTQLISSLGWRRSFGLDDAAAVFTLLCIVVFSVLMGMAAHHGFGMHKWQMTPAIREDFFKYITMFSPSYILAVGGYKATLLLLYLRIFNSSRTYRWLCRFGLFVVCGTTIANLGTQLFGCRPLKKFWEPKTPGYCLNFLPINAAFAALCVFNDFYVALLPIPILWRLQMEMKRKFTLILVLSVGVFAFICALCRLIFAYVDQHAADRTYFAMGSPIWSLAEVNVGLWSSCIPTLKAIFVMFKNQTTRRSSGAGVTPIDRRSTKPPSAKSKSCTLKSLSTMGITIRSNESTSSQVALDTKTMESIETAESPVEMMEPERQIDAEAYPVHAK